MDALQTISHIANPPHYGSTLGGLCTKCLWFVFGLILTGLSVTGSWIWTQRTAKAAWRGSKTSDRTGATEADLDQLTWEKIRS